MDENDIDVTKYFFELISVGDDYMIKMWQTMKWRKVLPVYNNNKNVTVLIQKKYIIFVPLSLLQVYLPIKLNQSKWSNEVAKMYIV